MTQSLTRKYLKALETTSPHFIKREVEEMTVQEAQTVWSHIKTEFGKVASLSKNARWHTLLLKMQWIKKKAETHESAPKVKNNE